ncbi:MAG: NADP-dependent phosphogluconate dehydrogenase [Flavobacteriaceae bacterium]|nr:NADP-dependent phosphogluconate dehydrogenase [Flavobacteriaceae bacterium]
MNNKTNFGIIGMGVMGRSLAKNIAGNGFSLSIYNRLTEAEKHVIPNFLKETESLDIQGFTEIKSFIGSLASPRKILLMVNAGTAVDSVIEQLLPSLEKGDLIIDGGNSHYQDTQRRCAQLEQISIQYLGVGVSGGEQGALYGPSMMVGGNIKAYGLVQPIFEAIAAKDKNRQACVSLLGSDGCGHFVKTIHNGIEYAEMQLLAECYSLLASTHSYEEIAAVFKEWNKGVLASYLLEITADILTKKEGKDYLLDLILDKAGSKGTGSWSSQIAFQLGVPASMINAAVTARYLSMLKEKRVAMASLVGEVIDSQSTIDVETLKQAYHFAKLINHYQGFEIIKSASEAHQWNVNLSEISRIWTQGCIIKSQLMESLVQLFKEDNDLLKQPTFVSEVKNKTNEVNIVLNNAFNQSIATPCISGGLQYWISITSEKSGAHLIQAQRDYFGAHTYQRNDKPPTGFFTTNWTANG